MKESIILAGGNSFRLQPETFTLKPLLPIGKETLLSLQTRWLLEHRFDKVVIATNKNVADQVSGWLELSPKVDFVIENKLRGTAGAVKGCLNKIEGKVVYVCNVDDLLLKSDPHDLLGLAEEHGASLKVAKPRLQFGRIKTRGDLAIRFQEKPFLGFYVSTGHYAFKRRFIEKFPDVGDLEHEVLPKLAKERKLVISKWKGSWIDINTMKDYLTACQ